VFFVFVFFGWVGWLVLVGSIYLGCGGVFVLVYKVVPIWGFGYVLDASCSFLCCVCFFFFFFFFFIFSIRLKSYKTKNT